MLCFKDYFLSFINTSSQNKLISLLFPYFVAFLFAYSIMRFRIPFKPVKMKAYFEIRVKIPIPSKINKISTNFLVSDKNGYTSSYIYLIIYLFFFYIFLLCTFFFYLIKF